ncbi:MAG TPA: RHS repeat domain-containing protein, partial [Actinocrinis sp.]
MYDAAGRRVERATAGGVVTRWSYDAVGQHTAMTGTAGSLVFAYDQVGRETGRLLGPGALAHRTYDPAGRLDTEGIWAYPHQDAAAASASSEPAQLQARVYSYLPDGTPTQIQDALRGTRRFELDAAGRVTRVETASWQAGYVYDALGNLVEAVDPATPEDAAGPRETRGTRIERAGRTTYEYDEAGRLIRRTRRTLSGQARVWCFSWDADGSLRRATLPG